MKRGELFELKSVMISISKGALSESLIAKGCLPKQKDVLFCDIVYQNAINVIYQLVI